MKTNTNVTVRIKLKTRAVKLMQNCKHWSIQFKILSDIFLKTKQNCDFFTKSLPYVLCKSFIPTIWHIK